MPAGRWIDLTGLPLVHEFERVALPWTYTGAPGLPAIVLLGAAQEWHLSQAASDRPSFATQRIVLAGRVTVAGTVPAGTVATVRCGGQAFTFPVVNGVAVLAVDTTAPGESLYAVQDVTVSLGEDPHAIATARFEITQLDLHTATEGVRSVKAAAWATPSRRAKGSKTFTFGSGAGGRPGLLLQGRQVLGQLQPGETPLAVRARASVTIDGPTPGALGALLLSYGGLTAATVTAPTTGGTITEAVLPEVAVPDGTVYDFIVSLRPTLPPLEGGISFAIPQLELYVSRPDASDPPVPGFDVTDQTPVPIGDAYVLRYTDTSTPGGAAIVSYAWDFGDGSGSTSRNPVAHRYPVPASDPKVYPVTLTVTDANGLQVPVTRKVTLAPVGRPEAADPEPRADFTWQGDTTIAAGGEAVLRFADASAAGAAAIVKWRWVFDTQATYTGRTPPEQRFRIVIGRERRLTVSLEVTDADGRVDTLRKVVTIQELLPPPPPPPTPITYTDPDPEPMTGTPDFSAAPAGYPDLGEYGYELGDVLEDVPGKMGLTKLGVQVCTQRARYSEFALAPVTFQVYAVPLPYGCCYLTRSQTRQEFVPIDAGGGTAIPPGASLVYENGVPVGYFHTVQGEALIERPDQFAGWVQFTREGGPQWFLNHSLIYPVRFPGVPCAPNGYPKPGHNGPIWGYFDVPTAAGMHREWRRYYRARQGSVWYPANYRDPAYCRTLGYKAYPTMLAGFPGRAAVPGRAASFRTDRREGWTGGADSVAAYDGDVRTTFQVDLQQALAVGFARARGSAGDYRALAYAFYFDLDPVTAALRVSAMEYGRRVAGPWVHGRADTHVLERVAGQVTFKINGAVMHTSRNRSTGELIVSSALYRAGDRVL